MADFDLTQTDAQVQSILDDAQDAQGAGAQTTLTTDYIMLKGTNGRYHKILKDSFTEAVRNVLAGLLVNNDKGTTISQIPAIASGDFGSVTPANLASVLGGTIVFLTNTDDINKIYTPGLYSWGSNMPNNAPIGYCGMLQIRAGDMSWFQVCMYRSASTPHIYYRIYDSSWSAWKQIQFVS